jgi:hypothetical protein
MPHPSQVSLAFLTDIGNTPHRPAKAQSRFPGRAKKPQQSDKPRAVVGDSGQPYDTTAPAQFELDVAWEDGVQMGAYDHRISFRPVVGKDDVANGVHHRRESQRSNHLGEVTATFFFLKWRRRDQRKANLVRLNLSFTILEDVKCRLNTGIRHSSSCTSMER